MPVLDDMDWDHNLFICVTPLGTPNRTSYKGHARMFEGKKCHMFRGIIVKKR